MDEKPISAFDFCTVLVQLSDNQLEYLLEQRKRARETIKEMFPDEEKRDSLDQEKEDFIIALIKQNPNIDSSALKKAYYEQFKCNYVFNYVRSLEERKIVIKHDTGGYPKVTYTLAPIQEDSVVEEETEEATPILDMLDKAKEFAKHNLEAQNLILEFVKSNSGCTLKVLKVQMFVQHRLDYSLTQKETFSLIEQGKISRSKGKREVILTFLGE